MWDLTGPGLEPVSPALAGGFLTTAPPGKPAGQCLKPKHNSSASNPNPSTPHSIQTVLPQSYYSLSQIYFSITKEVWGNPFFSSIFFANILARELWIRCLISFICRGQHCPTQSRIVGVCPIGGLWLPMLWSSTPSVPKAWLPSTDLSTAASYH